VFVQRTAPVRSPLPPACLPGIAPAALRSPVSVQGSRSHCRGAVGPGSSGRAGLCGASQLIPPLRQRGPQGAAPSRLRRKRRHGAARRLGRVRVGGWTCEG